MYSVCSGLFRLSVFIGAKSNFAKEMCMSECFTVSFFLVTSYICVCLLLVVTSISLSFELIWTLEQRDIDSVWKRFISKVNLYLFTLYLNIDQHTGAFTSSIYNLVIKNWACLYFHLLDEAIVRGEVTSRLPSEIEWQNQNKNFIWPPGSLSSLPLASSNADSSVNIPPESVWISVVQAKRGERWHK